MLRVSVFLALLAGASAAATGADSTCDTTLTLFLLGSGGTACTASSGVCPSTCLAALEALDTNCAGKKYTLTEPQNGKDVELALDWNTDKARYLILFQKAVNFGLSGSDDACNEVIHDYQLKHINDCQEARDNARADVVLGYYCKSPQSDANTCHVNCQEMIDKLESVCNPAGGPLGKYYQEEDQNTATTADDVFTEKTYSSELMGALNILGPKACSYKSTAPSVSSANSFGSLSVVASLLAAMVLAMF